MVSLHGCSSKAQPLLLTLDLWYLLSVAAPDLGREVSPHSHSLLHRTASSERDGTTRPPDLPLEKPMQVRKQDLELDMEQQTGSKQEKEYVKAVYCHPAYLTYMQSIS